MVDSDSRKKRFFTGSERLADERIRKKVKEGGLYSNAHKEAQDIAEGLKKGLEGKVQSPNIKTSTGKIKGKFEGQAPTKAVSAFEIKVKELEKYVFDPFYKSETKRSPGEIYSAVYRNAYRVNQEDKQKALDYLTQNVSKARGIVTNEREKEKRRIKLEQEEHERREAGKLWNKIKFWFHKLGNKDLRMDGRVTKEAFNHFIPLEIMYYGEEGQEPGIKTDLEFILNNCYKKDSSTAEQYNSLIPYLHLDEAFRYIGNGVDEDEKPEEVCRKIEKFAKLYFTIREFSKLSKASIQNIVEGYNIYMELASSAVEKMGRKRESYEERELEKMGEKRVELAKEAIEKLNDPENRDKILSFYSALKKRKLGVAEIKRILGAGNYIIDTEKKNLTPAAYELNKNRHEEIKKREEELEQRIKDQGPHVELIEEGEELFNRAFSKTKTKNEIKDMERLPLKYFTERIDTFLGLFENILAGKEKISLAYQGKKKLEEISFLNYNPSTRLKMDGVEFEVSEMALDNPNVNLIQNKNNIDAKSFRNSIFSDHYDGVGGGFDKYSDVRDIRTKKSRIAYNLFVLLTREIQRLKENSDASRYGIVTNEIFDRLKENKGENITYGALLHKGQAMALNLAYVMHNVGLRGSYLTPEDRDREKEQLQKEREILEPLDE